MPLSTDQTLLVQEVGDTADGRLAANVETIAAVWADADTVSPGLARLYVKRQLIDLAIGATRAQVDFNAPNDIGMKLSQRMTNLLTMRDLVTADLLLLHTQGAGGRDGASAELTTRTPQSPPCWWPSPPFPDANGAGLRGDPYRRPRGRWRP